MGKKFPSVKVTPVQKALTTAMLISALAFLFYHSAMSVLNKVIVYEGIWVTLQDVFFWMAAVTGATYLVYMLFLHPSGKLARNELKKKIFTWDYILLLFLLVAMYISVASIQGYATASDWWGANRSTLFDTTGQILILFPLGCWFARHRDAKEMRWPLHVFTIGFLIGEIYILYHVFTNSVISLANGGGIGITGQLNLSIHCHYNTTGLWGYCFLFLCFYLAVTTVKWLKPVYILGIIANLMILALSQSRTAQYSNCLAFGLCAGVWFFYQNKVFDKNKIQKTIFSVLVGIAVTAVTYFLTQLFYKFYLTVSGIEELLGKDATGRVFFDEQLSGRTDLWIASFKSMFVDARCFFFGVSPVGIYSRMEEFSGQTNVYTHNQILEFAVGCGVPAMIAFVVFCVRMFLHSVKICFTSGNRLMKNAVASIGCFLLLVGNMFEATLFGFNYISGMIFIVICGYLAETNRIRITPRRE